MMPVRDAMDTRAPNTPWLVLVIDDEPEVHAITRLALRDCEFLARRLEFLSARNAAEARATLARHPDIALAFIDVVMETEHAGLDLVAFIRQVMGNETMRLILRTGQAGVAPEREVIRDFDVNDYLTKTGISSGRLYTATIVALRTYAHLAALHSEQRQFNRYRGRVEALTGTISPLFEAHTLQELAGRLLEWLGSLMWPGDTDAGRLPLHGVVVQPRASGFDLLATLGRFQRDESTPLEPGVHQVLRDCLAAGRSLVAPGRCVAHFTRSHGRVVLAYLEGVGAVSAAELRLLELFSQTLALASDKLEFEHNLVDAQAEMVGTLSKLLAVHPVKSSNQARRLAHLSRLLARLHGLPEDQCQALFIVAPWHDIGRFANHECLANPIALSDADWMSMREHSSHGASMFEPSDKPLLQAAAAVAVQGHEWYDGSGHPQGLRAQDIHLFARIVAVVDTFNTLSHRIGDSPAWDYARVEVELQRGRGSQFDPALVDLLLERIDEAIEILRRFPDEGDPDWVTAPRRSLT